MLGFCSPDNCRNDLVNVSRLCFLWQSSWLDKLPRKSPKAKSPSMLFSEGVESLLPGERPRQSAEAGRPGREPQQVIMSPHDMIECSLL